jgi:NADH-quinone oxidoreductase subunit E
LSNSANSVLDHQIASPETPGTRNFPPFAPDQALENQADEYLSHYPADQKRSAVLPLIHMVQHKQGFISREAIDWIAGKLEVAPIKVEEVVTFYPGIRQSAPGKFHIRVCRTLSCAMGGSHELMARLCELTGIDQSRMDAHHQPVVVSPCGKWSVEFAECLASCGTAPVCLVNDDFHEGVSADKAQGLLDQYADR